MKIATDAIKQLRVEGQQMLKVVDILERLNHSADGYRPKTKRRHRMSRTARLKISKAQKKRWARMKR